MATRSDQLLMRLLQVGLRTLLTYTRMLPANDFYRQGTLDYRMKVVDVAGGDPDAIDPAPPSRQSSPRGMHAKPP